MQMKSTGQVSSSLTTLARAVEEFRKLDPTIQAQSIATFLFIAQNEGCSTADVGEALGLSQASASRNVGVFLKERTIHGRAAAGHDLVTQSIDPLNRRRRIIKLTPKGRRVSESIQHVIGG